MTQRSMLSRILGVAILAVGATAIPASADDDDLALADVPAKVRATIEEHVGDGTIEHIERERRRGEVVYEVDFEDRSGRDYEIIVAENGKVLDKRRDRF